MANVKYFSDWNGQVIEITTQPVPMRNVEFITAFPGIKGKPYDGISRIVARHEGGWMPVTRIVTFGGKNGLRPKMHKCDARCVGATGRTMNCECSCGGKNHGKGFSTSPAF